MKNSLKWANLSLFLLGLSIGSFPFVASVAMVLFCFFNVLYGYFNRKETKRRKFIYFLPIWGILVIYIACLIYSPNISYGLKYISRSLIFVIVPFVFWYRGGINLNTYLKTTKFFIIGVTLTCIISLLISSFNYLGSQNLEEFTYYQLADTIHLHPTYLSLFILAALILLHRHKKERLLFKLLVVVVSVLMLLLLQSRVAFIGLGLVVVYSFISSNSMNYKRGILFFSALIISLGFLSNDLKNRFNEIISYNPSIDALGTFSENGINQRVWLWNSAFKQIKKEPIFGYGLGAQRNLFQWQVEKMMIEDEFDNELYIAAKKLSENNLHNQYLQIIYECGYLGLFLFLGLLFFLGIILLKRKKHPELLVLVVVSLFLITENLFARQMGIYFFGFMAATFLSVSEEIE